MAAVPESSPLTGSPAVARSGFARAVLMVAFAFALMGDPVSSVAYAIEAALRALGGNPALLLPTVAVVVCVVSVVVLNYHLLIGRFPRGAGAAVAAATTFGEGWAFLPLGCLMVDFALTIAISVSAGASAIIAYLPGLAPIRIPLAIGLTLAVAGLTWFGHGGRAFFATMTLGFLAVAALVVVHGFLDPVSRGHSVLVPGTGPGVPMTVVLAYPVAMAWATGIEAPSAAIAQLGQLEDRGRRLVGRVTIWLVLGCVGGLTLALSALAVRLHVGLPPANSTLVALVARAAVGSGVLFAAFQAASALLLLAAANSGFNAGAGLLKALAAGLEDGRGPALLPRWLGRTNRHHTPYGGAGVFLAVSVGLVAVARGRAQVLVLYYAAAVFAAFLFGMLAMARQSRRERRPFVLAVNVLGVAVAALTLLVDVARVYPIAPLLASCAIAGLLYARWARAGRPGGVSTAEYEAGDGGNGADALGG